MTRVQGTNDYINAVFVDVSLVLPTVMGPLNCSSLFYAWKFKQLLNQKILFDYKILIDLFLIHFNLSVVYMQKTISLIVVQLAK